MIPDADRITHMIEAISKMRISLEGLSEVWKVITMDFPALEQQLLSIRKFFPLPPTV